MTFLEHIRINLHDLGFGSGFLDKIADMSLVISVFFFLVGNFFMTLSSIVDHWYSFFLKNGLSSEPLVQWGNEKWTKAENHFNKWLMFNILLKLKYINLCYLISFWCDTRPFLWHGSAGQIFMLSFVNHT